MKSVSTRLQDKVVLVTGATGGIGSETARRLADEGAVVYVTDLDAELCRKLVAELPGGEERHGAYALDVGDEDAWLEVLGVIREKHGRLDALVNNAGGGRTGTIETETREDWEWVMHLNVSGSWFGMKHSADLLRAAGSASVINLSSMWGTVGGMGVQAAYHAAKGAVRTMTKNAALHWADQNIRVNSVHPGYVASPNVVEKFKGTEFHDKMMAGTPVGRMGHPEEVAAAIAFLASDDSTFMTGSEVYVDGGFTAR